MGKFPGGFSGSLYVGLLLMAFNTAQAQPIALSISVSQAAVEEGEDLPFVVNLSQSLPSTGQLRYTLSGDTDNFLDGPGGLFSVDIPPDITSFPLNIPTDDDSTDEPNGIVTLALVSFRGGGFDEGFLTGVSVTVTDNDGDNIPDFGVSTTIPAQTYTQFTAITNLTLPAAVGGDGTLVYSISPLPAGLSFNAITRTLSGTPTTLQAATDYMVTVTDADGDTDTITFSIAVAPPTPPDAPTITRQSLSPAIHRFDWNDPNDNNCAVNRFQYVLEIRVIGESFGRAIASISVPNGGSGGTALLSTIDNPLPPGGYYRFEVEAVSDGVGGCGNRSQPAVFFFDPDTVGTVEMPDQSLAAGRIMDIDVSTAAVFTGITVTTWGVDTNSNPQAAIATVDSSGTVSIAGIAPGVTRIAVRGYDADSAFGEVVISVEVFDPVNFGSQTIADQSYVQNITISNLVVPAATDGTGTLTYGISPTPPAGLSFNAATRTLSGTPTTLQAATDYMVTVTDADGDTDTITFSIAVTLPMPPDAPTITRQAFSPTIHRLDWNDPSDNGCPVNRFNNVLEIRVAGDSFGQLISTGNSLNTAIGRGNIFILTAANPLPPGGYYRVEVVAISDGIGGCNNRSEPGVFIFNPNMEAIDETEAVVDRMLVVGTTINIDTATEIFSGMTFGISTIWQVLENNNPGVATATIDGTGTVSITGVALGTARIAIEGSGIGVLARAIIAVEVIEPASVTLSATSGSAAEDGGTTSYTVVLDTQPTADVTVTPASGNTDAATVSGALTFTDSNWNTPQTVTVTGVDDDIDSDRTATISHVVASASNYDGITVDDYTFTASDDDTAGLSFTPDSVNVGEAVTVDYTVVLDSEPTADVIVSPNSANTNAATVSPATLTFTASNWDTAQTVTVTGVDDANSASESLSILHVVIGGGDYGMVTGNVVVTTTDDDADGLSFTPGSVNVGEASTVDYSVVLNTEPSGNVIVTPTSENTDAATVSGALTFTMANWDTAQTVTVTGVDDANSAAETFDITHAASGGGYDAVTGDVGVTTTDDDADGLSFTPGSVNVGEASTVDYSVVLNTEPSGNVIVTPTSENTDAATVSGALTFTMTNWDTAQTVTVTGVDDANSAAETFDITHAASGGGYGAVTGDVGVTTTDDDADGLSFTPGSVNVGEASTVDYSVVLNTEPSGNVIVTPTSENTDAATVSGALTFTMTNWDTAQTVTVTGVDDANSAAETFDITHAASGGGYDAVTGDVGVTTTDDDADGLSFTPGSVNVGEASTVDYSVVLNTEPSGNVTVTPTSENTDAATVSGALTFTMTNWDTAQTVTVTGVDDANSAAETFDITHAASGGGYGAVTGDVGVTTTDDDADGLSFTPGSVNVGEASTVDYSVVLNTEPSGNVIVTPTSGNTDAATVSGALTFTMTNWDTAQTVTVTGVDDANSAAETFDITHAASGGGYGAVTGDVGVTTTDDDADGLSFTPGSVNVGEASTVDYSVVLNTEPSGNVTVTPTSENTDAATVSGALTFTMTNWDTAQTVTVTGVDDANSAAETFDITHAASGGGYGAVTGDVGVTTTDDDADGLSFTPGSVNVGEASTVDYSVVLNTEPSGNVTVTPTSENTDAATVSGALTFTMTNWDTAQTVTVTGVDDANSAAETFDITHAASGGGYGAVTGDVGVTTTDDDADGLSFTPGSVNVGEASTVDYSVVLNTEPSGNVIVTPTSENTDAATVSGALTFTMANWDTAQTVTVTGVDDANSAAETFDITHAASGGGYDAVTGDVGVTTTDDDADGLSFTPGSVNVGEASTVDYSVVLNTEPSGNVIVTPTSENTDAATVSGALTFTMANWDTAQTVTVTGVDDANSAAETFDITHAASGGGYGAVTGDVGVTTTDDDADGLSFTPGSVNVGEASTVDYSVVLNTEPSGNVTVTPTSENTDAATVSGALTFTMTNWDTAQTVTVTGVDDANSAAETFDITHAASGGGYGAVTGDVGVTTTDDDADGLSFTPGSVNVGEASTVDYSVVLNTEPSGNVIVTPTSENTDAATVSGALTFTMTNWDTAQTVTVTGVDDANSAAETFDITHAASGGGYGAVTGDVGVTTTDDDADGLSFTPGSVNVGEASTVDYSVVLNTEPSGNVTVTPTSENTDAATVSGALTFTMTNWDTAQTVTVTGVDDANSAAETFDITHAASGGGYGAVTGDVGVTTTDDDADGLSFTPGSVNVGEASTVDYSVVLNTEPSGNVIVTPTSENTDAATVSGALTFTMTNWDTAQTVTVTGVDDANSAAETFDITHAASGGGYGAVTGDVGVTTTDDDADGLSFTPGSVNVGEASTVDYSVVLNTEPSGNVIVTPTSENTDAATVSGALTFTMTNWDTAQTVTVTGVDDANSAAETFDITHAASGGGYGAVTGDVGVTTTDDDADGLSFTPGSVNVGEASTVDYSVVLNTEPSGNVTVTPTSENTDAATVSGALTFTMANWDTAQTVTVTGVDDANSAAETFDITHAASGGGYGAVTGDVGVTTTDDDADGLSFTPGSVNVGEASTVDYSVVLNTEPSGNVTVTPTSENTDAATVSGALTFTMTNWDTAQTVTVTGVDDANSAAETFDITHAASGGGYGAVTGDVGVTTTDDDADGLSFTPGSVNVGEASTVDYSVVLNTEPSGNVIVTPTSENTDAATVSGALTFTMANWDTAQTVTVTGVDDANSAAETFDITHAASGGGYGAVTGDVGVTTTDDDADGLSFTPGSVNVGEASTVDYSVVLNTEPSGNVIVTPTSENTDAATVSGALTFTMANWDTAQTVTVTGVDDANSAAETFDITHAASGGGYDAVTGDVGVTTTDDDADGLSFTPGSVNVGEASTVDYSVVLNTEPSGNVTVTPTSENTDAATVSGALTFTMTNWDTAQTVTVTGVDDANSAAETFDITHAASGGGYGAVTGDVGVTTTDDDADGLSFTPGSVNVGEASTVDYSVVLNTEPSGNVIVTPTSGNTDAATVSGALTFTMTNWDTAQTVTVTGVDDANSAAETFDITHAASGGGYGAVTGDVGVTTTDDDADGLSFTPGSVNVGEASTVDYSVVLNTEPSGNVTVTPTSENTDAATVSGALTFTMTNWDTAQTVTVTGVDDANSAAETFDITHAASGGGYGAVTGDVGVTTTDDDADGLSFTPGSVNVGEASTVDYSVVLNTEPSGNVIVTPTSENTDAATVSGALTFTMTNWDTAQTVTVTGVDDANSAAETFDITHAASGGGYGAVTGDVGVTTTDDDADGLSFTPGSVNVGEASTVDYSVVLNTEPSGNVTVTPTSENTDAATVSGALTFTMTNWDTAQTVTVTGVDDANSAAETFDITHAASGGGYGAVTGDVGVTTTDDDADGLSFTPGSVNVGEASTVDYSVVLNTEPSGNVIVTPTSENTDAATVSGALTFTMANWDTAQTVTVTGVDDANSAAETFDITHAASGGGYGAVTGDVGVTTTDDDADGLSFTPGSVNVGEASTTTYTVRLSTQPDADVTVTPTSGDINAVTVSSALTFTTSNFGTAQTITVTGVNDDNSVSETFNITHAASGGGYDSITGNVGVTTTDDDAPILDIGELNETVLPQVTQAVVRHTQGAVARRVEQAASGAKTLTIAGQSSLSAALGDVLSTHADAIEAGTLSLKDVLGKSDFVLPLNAASAKGSAQAETAPAVSLALWGSGEYRSLSDDEDVFDWDGDLLSATLGIDANLRNNILLGVAGSWSDIDVDYQQNDNDGDYVLSLVGVHPYLAWTGKRLSWWFTGGYSDGELSISDDANENSSEVTLLSLGTGASGVLWANQLTTLRLKGDILWAEMDVEGGDDISPYTTDVNGSRLLLEASQVHSLDGGVSLEPSLELGVRYDGGDGDDRTNMELGTGLRLRGNRLTLDGSVYALLGEDNLGDWDIREWGVRGLLHLQGGRYGEGLSFSLTPGYGAPERDAEALLWNDGPANNHTNNLINAQADQDGYGMRLDTELGYGIPAGQGMLTSYGQMSLGDGGQRYRLGLRWSLSELFGLELEGERRQRDSQGHGQGNGQGNGDDTDNAIFLRGHLRF